MTFLELCQTLRREIGVSGNGPSSVTSQTGQLEKIVNWIADADVYIQNAWQDWKFLWRQMNAVALTVGQAQYTPTELGVDDVGIWDINSLALDESTDDYKLLAVKDFDEWRAQYRFGVKTNAQPDSVFVKPDNGLIFDAPPDSAYSFSGYYWRNPVRMSTNNDQSLIPERFHRVIIAKAKIMYAEHDEAPEVMQGGVTEYTDLMRKLESLYLTKQEGRRQSVAQRLVIVTPQ